MLCVWLTLLCLTYASGFRIMCYFTNSAQYRPDGGKFLPEDIFPHGCTHIVYAVAHTRGLGLSHIDTSDLSYSGKPGMYERVVQLKHKHPDLKVLLALASSTNSTGYPYTAILQTPASRSAFVQNVVVFLRRHHFDGVEISWKYPDVHHIPIVNKEKFVLLFKEIMEIFVVEGTLRHVPRLLVSAVLPGISEDIQNRFNLQGILEYTDFISLLTYNYNFRMNDTVQISTPIYSDGSSPLSLHATLRYLNAEKFPLEKINLGISLAGRTYTLKNPQQSYVGAQSSGHGTAGPYTQTVGSLAYYEICTLIKGGALVVNYEPQLSRFLVSGDLWASFEDVRSVIIKACFAKDNGFGGVMVRSLDIDDFSGLFCSQGKFPLITAISSVIKDSSCRVYVPILLSQSGQRETTHFSPGWRFLLAVYSLLGFSFN